MEAISIGPLAIPVRPGLFILATGLALFIGNRIAKRNGTDIERAFWAILLVGVACARVAFVLVYRETYAAAPLTILDLRDGGMNAVVGVLGGLAMAGILAWRKRERRMPLLAALVSGALLWGGAMAGLTALEQQKALPKIVLHDLDGREVPLAALAGRPMVVNMWATWCPPCRREMPVLRDAQQTNADIVFVFANQGESAETIKRYLDAENLNLHNVLIDRGEAAARAFGSIALPSTFFYDENGKHVDSRIGELSAATLAQRVGKLKAGK